MPEAQIHMTVHTDAVSKTESKSEARNGMPNLVRSIATMGLAPFASVGADLVGPRTMTLVLGGITGAIAVIVYFASPTIREYRLSEAIVDTESAPSPEAP